MSVASAMSYSDIVCLRFIRSDLKILNSRNSSIEYTVVFDRVTLATFDP